MNNAENKKARVRSTALLIARTVFGCLLIGAFGPALIAYGKIVVLPPVVVTGSNPGSGGAVNFETISVHASCSDYGLISVSGWGCVDSSVLEGRIDIPSGGGPSDNGGGSAESNTGDSVAGRNASGDPCAHDNPILPSTGNKIEPESDFASFGDMPLALTRTYNHYWMGVGLFGKNWVSNFDYMLTFGTTDLNACFPRPGGGNCTVDTNTIIYAWRPDGRTIKFVKKPDGSFYEDKPEAIAKIQPQSDGTLILSSEDQMTETYSAAGRIAIIRDNRNVGWTFTYANGTYLDRVTHSSTRYVGFTWNNGQLSAVRDPSGASYMFTYSANQFGAGLHRLASTQKPATPATTITYHYEQTNDASALTGKSFNGIRYSRFTYDGNGYAASSEHIGAYRSTFTYTPGADGTLTVEEKNPLGKLTTYTYKGGNVLTVTGHPSTNCPSLMYAETTYDANGYPLLASDFNGNETAYTYNAKGQLLKKIEAYGSPIARTTEYTWNADNSVTDVKIAGVSEIIYGYAASGGGRPTSMQIKNLSANGVANEVHSTTYAYSYHAPCTGQACAYGILASLTVDGPLHGTGSADVVTRQFDTFGNLTSITDGAGNVITYSNHTGLGLPGRTKGANGDITDYVYDARSRPIQMKTYRNGATQTYLYEYDGFGRLAATTAPDGQKHVYQYDVAGRLILESEAEAGGTFAQTAYTYNAMSLPTSINTQRSTVQALQGTQP